MEWTDESIQRLRAFWTEGLSTAEIGRRLGVSKNAVVGKAHRLDLTARPSPIRWEAGAETTRRRNRRPAEAPRPDGPTLPPLSSTVPPLPPVVAPPVLVAPAAALAAPPVAPVPVVAAPVVAAPVVAAPVVAAPVVAPVAPQPAALVAPAAVVAPAPQRAPPQPQPRLEAVTARPYGRVVTCCWPLGEPGTKSFRFCDAASVPGKPYCDGHAQLAYVKVRDRREDAA